VVAGATANETAASGPAICQAERMDDRLAETSSHAPAPEDVLLDVPTLSVDEIELEVANLRARVSLNAEVLNLLKLNVGVDADIGQLRLDIKGVQVQALLKVRLDRVEAILGRVLSTIDAHPEIVTNLTAAAGQALEETGRGAGSLLKETGGGARSALTGVGRGADNALTGVGQGAGDALKDVGQGAGRAVGELPDATHGLTEDVAGDVRAATEDIEARATTETGEAVAADRRDLNPPRDNVAATSAAAYDQKGPHDQHPSDTRARTPTYSSARRPGPTYPDDQGQRPEAHEKQEQQEAEPRPRRGLPRRTPRW
jgi:hypothetical protein